LTFKERKFAQNHTLTLSNSLLISGIISYYLIRCHIFSSSVNIQPWVCTCYCCSYHGLIKTACCTFLWNV